MLETASKYENALSDLVRATGQSTDPKREKLIDDKEWDNVGWCLNLLKPFYDTTDEVFHKDYPTMSTVFPVMFILVDHLNAFKTDVEQ